MIQLLTVPEAAALLAISRSKLYRYIQDGSMPSVHIGGSRRISHEDLQDFVNKSRSNFL